MSKINYGELSDVSGKPGITTIKALAAEFASDDLKVSKILKEAGVNALGKLPSMKDGKAHKGKPTLGFDSDVARKAVEEALKPTKA